MKNTSIFICILCLFFSYSVFSQEKSLPLLEEWTELSDTKPFDSKERWDKLSEPVQISWGSTDNRYPKLSIPDLLEKKNVYTLKGWKGERINAQAIIWTNKKIEDLQVNVSDLKNGSEIIPSSVINAYFVRYVITDELSKDGTTGCGHRPNKSEWDSTLVADILDPIKIKDIQERTTQPLWFNTWIPENTKAGIYKGEITVAGKNIQPLSLQIEVEVLNHTLPTPSQWSYHLDLWQNPYAVARYYQVPLWSNEHFGIMLPLMKRLAEAGQKVVTATIMHKPWDGQTEDHFDSMVFRMKKLDGSWEYDYTVFDKWVEFMMYEVGITKQINCYTMIPWALSFDYYDQATNRIKFIKASPGDPDYENYWLNFLQDFSRHLKQKGWFEKTTIAMDERGLDAMQKALAVIRKADPNWKVSFAGLYHPEINPEIYDCCLGFDLNFTTEEKSQREKEGLISTFYTCCAEPFPNTFTFSDPAEATCLGWHALAGNYDGYLRWAYNSWTSDPLRDTRFHTWAAGDCFLVYPGNRSSIRFERLIEGIQDYEKVKIIIQNTNPEYLTPLYNVISKFTSEELMKHAPSEISLSVYTARLLLNTY